MEELALLGLHLSGTSLKIPKACEPDFENLQDRGYVHITGIDTRIPLQALSHVVLTPAGTDRVLKLLRT